MTDLKTRGLGLLLLLLSSRVVGVEGAAMGESPLRVEAAELHGLESRMLEDAWAALAVRDTRNFLVLRNGKIVFERYSEDSGLDRRHYTASLAKALVGGMSLAVALSDGRLRIDDPAWLLIPAWEDHPEKSRITIRQLATHSSGVEDAEQDDIPHMELPGWKGRFWKRSPDPFSPAIYEAPVMHLPGTAYAYSNPGMAALAYAVTACLGEGLDLRELLRTRIMEPIGAESDEWSVGYDQTFELDGLKLVANWGGGAFTARAAARVGLLMLQRGNWQGRQLLEPAWVERVSSYAGTPLPPRPPGNPQPGSGLGWWSNFDSVWPAVPKDAFAGAGAGQQVLMVVPSLGLVIVRNGGVMREDGLGFWGGIEKYVFNPVMEAVRGYTPGRRLVESAPYPPSPVIREMRFAEKASIVRRAFGSDNWPLTWGEDDHLYAAYGDGWGFEPQAPRSEKLSLGLARILGSPLDFQGINLRSPSGEQRGDGASGKKASGMLSVSGRLYMLVRNAGNAQLAWSDDHGVNWNWEEWRFTRSFGHPVFLNFGKDYAGARDDFVYVYSHDRESAYEPADQMVMARVPRQEIRDLDAYEYFTVLSAGSPVWTEDVEGRGGVFANPGKCYRSSISYSAPLGRYLWVQVLPGSAPRFHGGLGIYDAPEPWGPWTTAFYTEFFDVGPGENAHLPTKWMSSDGSAMYLVSSGDDAFSVRKVELVLAPGLDR